MKVADGPVQYDDVRCGLRESVDNPYREDTHAKRAARKQGENAVNRSEETSIAKLNRPIIQMSGGIARRPVR
jgi:hypothetical protein